MFHQITKIKYYINMYFRNIQFGNFDKIAEVSLSKASSTYEKDMLLLILFFRDSLHRIHF